MKFVLAFLAALCLAQAVQVPTMTADKQLLHKQKAVYELFWHVNQPTVYHPELYQKARSYSIQDNLNSYTDKAAVTDLLQRLQHGMLPRGAVFSIFYPEHKEEAVVLFKVLHSAKDFDTFYNTAVWARFNVNEQMYVYVLSVAVLHRPDTRYVRIPPLYEVLPHFFFNEDVLHHAYHIAMGDTGVKKTVGGYHVIHTNYTGWYLARHDVPEQKLTYFTEDVGLNAYYFLYSHDFPFWKHDDVAIGRGELYLFGHKQLLARYYMERLSNDLGEIEYLDWHAPIPTGYYPNMHFYNGLPFPHRETHAMIPLHKQKYVQQVEEYEQRIGNVIDSGYIFDTEGKHVNVYTPGGLNLFGNVIQGNVDAHSYGYYGPYDALCRKILGFSLEPASKYQVAPSALEIYSTSMRDPVFYSMYKRVVNYYIRYKRHLPPYSHEQLSFPGVKIDSVTVDKLMTFFDHFETKINNAVSVHSDKESPADVIKARQHRLNHKPFTYHISINSDKSTKGMIRIFFGPKYDVHGHELDISENHQNFLEVDEWVVELKPGVNKIERNSHESIFVVPDEVPSDVFYKKVLKALEGGETYTYSSQLYGFPDRLMLPKGKREGMPFKLFVHIAPFDEADSVKAESPIWGTTVTDKRSLGYPLDRHVHAHNFTVPNMYMKDVLIYHKQMEELNVTV